MSVLAASLTGCRKMGGRCCSLCWCGNWPPARAAPLADRVSLLVSGPGEKAYENIFVWEDILRHRFLSHLQGRSVPCAIVKVPSTIKSLQVLAHLPPFFADSEENA